MGGDGKTILNYAGTGTTQFSGGLFLGVNSDYFWGNGTNIFGWCGKTVLNLAGTGTTK